MTVISSASLTYWGIDWAQQGGSPLGLSQGFSLMLAGAGILSCLPLSSAWQGMPAAGRGLSWGCRLGSRPGLQAASATPHRLPHSQWPGSETRSPENRVEAASAFGVGSHMTALLQQPEAVPDPGGWRMGAQGRREDCSGGIARSECEAEASIWHLGNLICHTRPQSSKCSSVRCCSYCCC